MDSYFHKIFMIVALNWNDIMHQETIKNLLDLKTNILCKKIKIQDPHLNDDYIQMCTLSMMLSQILCLKYNDQIYMYNDINPTQCCL